MARPLLFALLTGVATAVGVGAFKLLVGGVEWLAFGWRGESFADLPPILVLAVPVAGGLVVGLALRWAGAREDPDHGVTEVIQAATLDAEEFPDRAVPLQASLAGVSLGSGASLGPEDPSVEIGGGVGEALGRWARLPHAEVRALVAAGAAAGLSSLLLAPIAAILFTLEVFAVRPVSRTLVLVATASVVAFVGMRLVVPGPPLVLPSFALPLLPGALLALGLGLATGLVSVFQVRLTYGIRHLFLDRVRVPRWVKPALGGLVLGAAGLVLPQLLGIGYETVERSVTGERPGPLLLLVLLAGKLLLVAVSFGSGFRGGFFAPAFFIGAVLGVLYGEGVDRLLAESPASPAAFGVMGMAAALAGTVHAPLTAAFVLVALVADAAILPLLLVACLTSYGTARLLEPGSLYTYPLRGSARRRLSHAAGPEDFRGQPDLD